MPAEVVVVEKVLQCRYDRVNFLNISPSVFRRALSFYKVYFYSVSFTITGGTIFTSSLGALGALGGAGGLGGAAGLFFTIFGGVKDTCSIVGGGGGRGTSFNSIGGAVGGLIPVLVFCAISCAEIMHTTSTSIVFFICKFCMRCRSCIYPYKILERIILR